MDNTTNGQAKWFLCEFHVVAPIVLASLTFRISNSWRNKFYKYFSKTNCQISMVKKDEN